MKKEIKEEISKAVEAGVLDEPTQENTLDIQACLQGIKDRQAQKKEQPSTPYADVIKARENIEQALNELKVLSSKNETLKGEPKTVENIPKSVLDALFKAYTPDDFLTDPKKYSQNINKLNSSLYKHKFNVISSKTGDFRLTFK